MNSPLRVAAIGITPPLFKASGGISAGIQLTRHIARLCDARFVLMSAEESELIEDGLRVSRWRSHNALQSIGPLLPKQLVTMMWRPRLRRFLETERPSLVHFHNPNPPGALAEAARDCVALGIPYVVSTHGFVEFSDYANAFGRPAWQRPFFQRFVRQQIADVARNAAQVLMLSPEEEPILRGMGVRPERLDLVTNGVDPYFLDALSQSELTRLVSRFNIPTDAPIVFFVGNHTANKGIDVLLRAIPSIQVPAIFVVGGAIRSRSEHTALLAGAKLDPNDSRLRFTDFITKEELRALYQSSTIFAFPSYADTLPLVILEAMASGLPVVSTRVGGIPFQVTPETGELISTGDAFALANSLNGLLMNRALRQRLGTAGRQRAMDMFNWDKSAIKAVEIYRRVAHAAEIS